MTDLFEDIKDGVMLLALLEILSGHKLVSFTVIYTAYFLIPPLEINLNWIQYKTEQTRSIKERFFFSHRIIDGGAAAANLKRAPKLLAQYMGTEPQLHRNVY